jgi:pimeloyl-ACP methyl ester carboxylesterase
MVENTRQEKSVRINGLNLVYLDWGNEEKMPLLCLHGHGSQAHVFDEFGEAMSPYYRVLALNQRGHGGSDWAADGYARDRFVEDLSAFVDELELTRFVLVGLSMGGWHSFLYVPKNPERVERIIIGDIAPEATPQFVEYWLNRSSTPLEFPDVGAALLWGRSTNPRASDERIHKDVLDKIYQRADGTWTHKADPLILADPLVDLTDPAIIERYWKGLTAITCPILAVRGGLSPLVSDEVNERMAEVAKDFRSVDIPDSGHPLTTEQYAQFIEVTSSFLGVRP